MAAMAARQKAAGAFVVAASLLKAGGKAEDDGIVGIAAERDAQPGFGLRHIGSGEGDQMAPWKSPELASSMGRVLKSVRASCERPTRA